MIDTLTQPEVYEILHCASCNIAFGVTASFEAARRSDRERFYCPAGHGQWFPGKTDEKRIEELKAQLATKDDLLRSTQLANHKFYRLQRAAEGRTRALKRRIAAGVCICCKRTFSNLARHMKTKHPTFTSEIKASKRAAA